MDEEFLLNQAIKRYDDEVNRMKDFDNKASNQIGFVGIILAVIGFIFGNNLNNLSVPSLFFLIAGMIVLLLSIGLSVYQLSPKIKQLPVLKIREFYQDWKNNKLEVELIEIYLDHIDDMMTLNNSKLHSTNRIYTLTISGLIVSFIGILTVLLL